MRPEVKINGFFPQQMDHPHSVSGMSGLDMLGSPSPATEQAGSNPAASVAAALQMSAAAGGGGDPTVGSLAAAAAAHLELGPGQDGGSLIWRPDNYSGFHICLYRKKIKLMVNLTRAKS